MSPTITAGPTAFSHAGTTAAPVGTPGIGGGPVPAPSTGGSPARIERLGPTGQGPSRKGAKDLVIERFEQKFMLHPRLVAPVREFIRPFCIPDPNGRGEIPEYIVTTLQLDTPTMDLALAKERKAFSRFKLRIRTYGTDAPPKAPIFLEIKRKVGNVIIKSRAKLNRATYHEKTVTHPDTAALLKSPKDNAVQLEFCRVANEIGARPKILIRYIRESYFGANDDYARITFDRRISYRRTREWLLPGPEVAAWKYWRPMDVQEAFRRDYPAYIFELKSMRDSPTWMLETIERFNLVNTGFCKYATAWRLETLQRGFTYTIEGANTTY
jgi:hypothetical protein